MKARLWSFVIILNGFNISDAAAIDHIELFATATEAYQACVDLAASYGVYGACWGTPVSAQFAEDLIPPEGEEVIFHFVRYYYEHYALADIPEIDADNACDASPDVGNPVNSATGNKKHREDLIRIGSVHPVVFNLYYNSQRIEKWRHSFSRSLRLSSVAGPAIYNISNVHFNQGDVIRDHAAPESLGGFGINETDNALMGKYMAMEAVNEYRSISPVAACQTGWPQYRSRYHYSWIPGSYGQYDEITGLCDIFDSSDLYRMSLSVYSFYRGTRMVGNAPSNPTIRLTRENGSVVIFTKVSDTEWKNQSGTGESLQVANGYFFRNKHDEVEEYDQQGRLISIAAANSHVQALSYNALNQLERVESQTGEFIEFYYQLVPGSSNIYRIDYLQDNAFRRWNFRYDAQGNPEYIDFPDGSIKQYYYEDSLDAHALTGIRDQRGIRYGTWAYDAEGRAYLSAHGENADIDRVIIDYRENENNGVRTVTRQRSSSVGSPASIESTYSTQTVKGKSVTASITGPACSSCGTSNIRYEHDADTGYLMWKEENGARTEYGNYDSRGHPGYVIEAAGTVNERRKDYTYDPRFHSKVATITEPSVFAGASKVTTYAYDSFGNIESVFITGFRPDGTVVSRTTSMQYLGPYHQITRIDGPRTDVSDIINFAYYPDTAAQGNNRARLSLVSGPDGTAIRSNINYTATGKILNEYRANNLYISYSYYPGNDQLQEMQEQDTVSGVSRITRWTYLATGEIETITRGAGSIDATSLKFGYDDARRLTRITDGLGNYIEYILDSEGNVEQESYHDVSGVLRKNLTQTFDLYNRLDNVSQLNEQVDADFNPNGTLAQSTDGKGVVTDYDYDNLLRLTSMTRDLGGTDPATANALTQYTYDVQDRVTSVTDANDGQTLYVYDDLGNLLNQTSPDTGTTMFTHDEAGNIASSTDAKGQLFSYSYDAYNRLTLNDAPGTVDDIQMTYDTCVQGYGRLCQVQRHNSTLVYGYNGFGEQVSLDQNQVTWQGYNTADVHLGYSYDDAGRIKTITYPSGAIISYGYDAAGQVESVEMEQTGTVTALSQNVHYLPFGPISDQVYGNNIQIYGIYDVAFRVFIIGNPEKYLDYVSDYDANGNVSSASAITSVSAPGHYQDYLYDAHNRLNSSSGDMGLFAYGYDLVGNKSSQSIDGATESFIYEPNSNRMSAANDPVELDANGNTTHLRGMTLGYTTDNRLKTVNTGVAFEYDGLGQRSSKKTVALGLAGAYGFSQTHGYVYGLNGELLAELGPTGKVIKEYIYMNAKPLAMLAYRPDSVEDFLNADMDGDGSISVEDYLVWNINDYYQGNVGGDVTGDGQLTPADSNVVLNCALTQGSCQAASYATTLYYVHNDHLGTPKMLTDTSGTPVWRAIARPFGKATVNDDVDGDGVSVEFNLRQPGQYYDRETGLYYNYYRYYDPETGRYITSDPIGLAGGINIYAYVENNPLNYVDPLGLSPFGPKPGLTPLIRPHSTFYPKPSPIPKPNGVPQPRINESPQAYKNRLDQWVKDRNSNLKSETRQPSSNSLGNKTKEKVDGFAKLLKKFMESLKDGDFGAMPPILPYPDLPADHPLNKPQC